MATMPSSLQILVVRSGFSSVLSCALGLPTRDLAWNSRRSTGSSSYQGGPRRFSVKPVSSDEPRETRSEIYSEGDEHVRYRIFPGWQTSFFWKDLGYTDADPDEDWTVEHEYLEARYLTVALFFRGWRDRYEATYEKEEIHYGLPAGFFLQAEERVAWCIEGFLMACCVVLQDGAMSVEYSPELKRYFLEKDNLDEQPRVFLGDMEALL